MPDPELLRDRLVEVQERIAAAASRAGRDAGSVGLVVVTKGHPVETVEAVVEAGARQLGENYADEAVDKINALAGSGVSWHMIGHVQSRKAGLVAAIFDAVHSLDSVKLARRLHEAQLARPPLPVLIQVNVSGEESKFGLPAWDERHLSALTEFARQVMAFDQLRLSGLMTLPPFLPPGQVRPFFRRLAVLRTDLQREIPGLLLPELSMGMSSDFEVAVEEGATLVRVGTAILGPR